MPDVARYDEIADADGELAAIQICTKELLEEFAEFDGVTVLYEQQKDLVYQIDQAVANLGLCAVVLTIEAQDDSPNVSALIFDEAYVVIEVRELPVVNRAGGSYTPASKLAELAAKNIKEGMSDGSSHIGRRALIPKKLTMTDPPKDQGLDEMIFWHVICQR